jgi:fatty acid desaturase
MVLLVGVLALVVLPYLLNGDKSLSDVSVFTGMIVVGVWLAQGVPLMIVFMVGHELLHASHVKLKRWLDSKFPSLAEDDTPS